MIKSIITDIKDAIDAEENGNYCWAAILYRRMHLKKEAEECENLAQWIALLPEGKGF